MTIRKDWRDICNILPQNAHTKVYNKLHLSSFPATATVEAIFQPIESLNMFLTFHVSTLHTEALSKHKHDY